MSKPLVLTATTTSIEFQSLGVSRSVQFSMRIRTRSQSGRIAHCAGQTFVVADFVLLRLSSGRPRLTVNWGGGPLVVQSDVSVADGQWHSLEVIVEPSTASVFVDGRRFDGRAHFSDASLLDLDTGFFVGAMPEGPAQGSGPLGGGSRRGIVGCVDRIRIRGRSEGWRTAFAASPHAATECVNDFLSCNRTGVTCPDDDVDGSDPSSNTTFISVVEGDRAAISTDLIESISGGALSQRDIRFRAATRQLHGNLSFDDQVPPGDELDFSLSDIADSRVWYVHDGSETTSDSMRLTTSGNRELLLPVIIIPANDPPVVRLPPNNTLTLVSNTRMRLTSDLLSAVDPDDVTSGIQFGVYPSDSAAGSSSGYFELATSSGIRARITRFTQLDVETGRVYYVHRGATTQLVLIDASDGKDTSGLQQLTVVGLPLSVFPVINTGGSVPRSGNVVIGTEMLSFDTNAAYLDAVDIRYTIVEPPFYGQLQKLVQYRASERNNDNSDNRMWIVASSFTQTQLNESCVRYVHDSDADDGEDYFLFRVSAVGAGQTADTDAEYHFRLSVVECTVKMAASRPLFVDAVDRVFVVTSGELRFVSNFPRHHPDDVIYRVRSPARLGDLFVENDRKRNQRRRVLTSGDRFTQADVDGGKLKYRTHPATDPVNDTIEVDVSTSCADRRRHILSIYFRPITGSDRLINVRLTGVEEGGSAVIGPSNLNVEVADDQPRRNFFFSIIEPPLHGMVQFAQTGKRNNVVSRNNATVFGVEDIAAGRVRYVHDDSETRNDSFVFVVSETVSGDVTSGLEVTFRDRFLIDVELENDNLPRRVSEATLEVVFGVGRRLGPQQLTYADADVDTDRLEITWRADPDTVEFVSADDRWTPMYQFTQDDVDAGLVYVQHYSGSENNIVIWVSDGLHFVTSSLVVRASEPFVRTGNGSGLTVAVGQSVVVSEVNLGFETNIDAHVVFQVKLLEIINYILLSHGTIQYTEDRRRGI